MNIPDIVQRARDFAATCLEGMERGNGTPFLTHVDGVAEIVRQEIGLDSESVAAVYLHEATRHHQERMEGLQKAFGADVYRMVGSLNRIATISPKDTRLQAENYRKLIVSYSGDPRVTLIKLADRLEVTRSLDCFSKTDQLRKATETLFLYAPLAHQLGLYKMKGELEDRSFKVLQPEAYRLITNTLTANEIERKQQIAAFVAPLEEALKKAGIEYELKSRTKTTYSIHKKMVKQHVGVEGVFDILAIRFIIEAPPEKEKELCWQVYSIVTHLYEPIPERLRDWITVPKPSGYESLHATVTTPQGQAVEVQIRSRRMDYVAEYGVAAHWAYKGVRTEQVLQEWLNNVRTRLQSQTPAYEGAETASAEGPAAAGDSAHLMDSVMTPNMGEIYVFTPNGDLRRLPAGATVLDFAFHIHSNVGLHCTGARVNDKMAQVRDKLATGDVVEVLTSKNQKPSRDWLSIVVSAKAKNRIRQKLREEEGVNDVAGRELLERRLKNWKIEYSEELAVDIQRHFKFKQLTEFYSALGDETLSLQEVKDYLVEKMQPAQKAETPAPAIPPATGAKVPVSDPKGTQDYLVIDNKLGRIGYQLAKCCNPVVGDPVFGFVSIKDGVKIHRMTCPNAQRLMTQYPYRIQKVRWRITESTALFQAAVRFSSYNEPGLAQEVQEVIKNLSINLRHFSYVEKGAGKYEGRLQVAVTSQQQLNSLLFHVRRIKGVLKANRE